MDNARIRRRAWGIFKDNWPRFAMIGLIVSLLQQLVPMLTRWITGNEMPAWGSIVYVILLAPVTDVGMTCVSLGAWRRGAPEMSDLFSFLSPAGRLLKAMALSVVVGLMSAASMMGVFLPLLGAVSGGGLALAAVATLALFVLWFWLMLRLWMATAALVLDPDAGVFRAIATAWRASRGNLGRILGMTLMVMWPVLVLNMVASLTGIFSGIFSIAIGIVYLGYALTADAALAHTLIGENQPPLEQEGNVWTLEGPARGGGHDEPGEG